MNWVYQLLADNHFDFEALIKDRFDGNKDLFIMALISELSFKTGFIDGTLKLKEISEK